MSDKNQSKTPGFNPKKDDVATELARFELETTQRVGRLARDVKTIVVCVVILALMVIAVIALGPTLFWNLR